jgi:hypothetical protein
MIHDPPVGCLWDWWVSAKQRTAAMLAARICPSCRQTLSSQYDVSEDVFDAISTLLEYVRRNMMSGHRDVPDRVLVLHGTASDWKDLVDLLKGFGLESIEEFTTKPVTGMVVSNALAKDAEQRPLRVRGHAPDDPCGQTGLARARQNVVHEIGLCHARIGIESTAILLAEGTEPFSNMGGINHLDFIPGPHRGQIRGDSRPARGTRSSRGGNETVVKGARLTEDPS